MQPENLAAEKALNYFGFINKSCIVDKVRGFYQFFFKRE